MHIPTGGRLLDRVCYCMKPLSDATNILGEPIKIHDTFPYNPESKTAPNTAKRWANTDRYDYATKTTIVGPEPVIIDRVNEPFSVTITDLHFRSEGGRAYKVVDEEMRRFDLREDQVIEVMRNVGIAPGGAVPATFVWGMLGSQMRLVLVGGELHKSMMAGLQEKKDFDLAASSGMHPTEATLQPGHIYRKKDKTLHLFIGRVKRSDVTKSFFAFVQMPEAPRNWDDVDLDAHYYGNCREEWKAEREIAKKWDSMSWVDRCQWTWYDQREFTQKQYPTATPGYYHCPGNIVLMSSPKFEADVGEEVEFAERIRLNEGSKHCYVNGHGNDIAEDEWVKANNNHRREWHSGHWDYRVSHEERQKQRDQNYAKVQKEYLLTRAEFQKGLTWL